MKRLVIILFLLTGFSRSEAPVVTVTIDAPTNVVIRVVLTNSIPSPPPYTNTCDREYELQTSSGTNDDILVFRVTRGEKTFLRRIKPTP